MNLAAACNGARGCMVYRSLTQPYCNLPTALQPVKKNINFCYPLHPHVKKDTFSGDCLPRHHVVLVQVIQATLVGPMDDLHGIAGSRNSLSLFLRYNLNPRKVIQLIRSLAHIYKQ